MVRPLGFFGNEVFLRLPNHAQIMSSANRLSFIDPARSRLFYGYVVLFIGTLGVWCSIPGQTIGVSVFTDPVMDALGLSRDQFSNAYAIGTILSSLFISKAGRWFDRFGARYVAFAATLMLAFSVLLCSQADRMSLRYKGFLIFLLLRFPLL
ncbi:MFS transporter [Aureicoccus marinus]|uniref:hypothetical protein n=1 Tax=Aureicoccus marinus TaxID=754435 RepID=UPI001FE53EE6|nr:hypothetical protein [Aureicoccus marinus]